MLLIVQDETSERSPNAKQFTVERIYIGSGKDDYTRTMSREHK